VDQGEYTRADGTIGKVLLPSTHAAEPVEHILYCLMEFLEAAHEYGWQGQVRFQKQYRKTLTGNARTKWDLSVAAGPHTYDKFVEYMHHVKIPASMDPSTLVDRAQTLFHCATYLPIDENTAGPEIPVVQQKQMMLNMFPEPWVRNFTNSGQNPSTVTIVTLLSYMNEQHSAEVMCSERKCDFNHYGQQNDNTKRMHGNGNGYLNHFDDYYDGHNGNNNDYHHHHDHSADNPEHNHNHYNGNY
jgi:hypothetical protein